MAASFNGGCDDIAAGCRAAATDGAPTLGSGVVDPEFPAFVRACHDAGIPLVSTTTYEPFAFARCSLGSVFTPTALCSRWC